jgi:hypothetical protein
MFKELAPYLRQRAVLLTVTRLEAREVQTEKSSRQTASTAIQSGDFDSLAEFR